MLPRQRRQAGLGLGVVALGAALAAGAVGIPAHAGYAGVGPNFLPWVVSAVLLACGLGLLWQAFRGGFEDLEEPAGAERADWGSGGWVAAGALSVPLTLVHAGFVLSCTLCFVLASQGLRRSEGQGGVRVGVLVRDGITGFLVAAPAYWTFTRVLGISLPSLTGTGWL